MKKWLSSLFIVLLLVHISSAQTFKLTKEELKNKIKGGWAGQTIACTFGGPTEFKYPGTLIQDYVPIPWYDGYLKWYYENIPGLYDDVYMDLTFVDVFEKEGLDAPASSFAKAFAHAEYTLWHANQGARYNILRGIMPPESGNWINNPHADDIDYQIEADFSGLMSPGMPNTAAAIGDKIGHIMNSGDGWYGGIYVGAMYSLAFISNDVKYVVEEGLKEIPAESQFAAVMRTAIQAYKDNPKDWKSAWSRVLTEWSDDVGCPSGVFKPFDIDASMNCAWVVIGLLYGEKDFGKTIGISARCGDDSDCNPATAGGILGTMLGYNKLPEFWKMGLAEVEPMNFKYTTISLNKTYDYSFKHAVENIKRNSGKEEGDSVVIAVQTPKPVKLEKNFEGHFPVELKSLNKAFAKDYQFEFDGIGFAIDGSIQKKGKENVILEADMLIDDKLVETTKFPSNYIIRKDPAFWRYKLPKGHHTVKFVIKNPTDGAEIYLGDAVIYDDKPRENKY